MAHARIHQWSSSRRDGSPLTIPHPVKKSIFPREPGRPAGI